MSRLRPLLLVFAGFLALSGRACAQAVDTSWVPATDSILESKQIAAPLYPNIAPKSIMSPAGWSATGRFLFFGLGGTYPQVYSTSPDLIAVVGVGAGNSYKWASVVAALNINDVSAFNNFSCTLLATHTFPREHSIGVGVLHLFADPAKSDSPPSMYLRYSHVVQNMPSRNPGYSRLCYTVGVGTGRFALNSDYDIAEGKNKKGTIVFGNVSYELFRNVNVIAEWTGVNLCATVGFRPSRNWPAIALGVADITHYSGNGPRLVFGVSYALRLP